jgi:hypothetical protein
MAKEIKVKFYKSLAGNLVFPFNAMPSYLQEEVNKLKLGDDFTLTLSVPDPRGDWIEKWYKKAKDALVTFRFHKTVTICYDPYDPIPVLSDVREGDTYDRKTGIAVAYAKHCGEPIPDFI